MRKITFYPHLAITNVLCNNQFYLPYLLTNIATVAMFYILAYLSFDDTLASFPSANNVQVMMAGLRGGGHLLRHPGVLHQQLCDEAPPA